MGCQCDNEPKEFELYSQKNNDTLQSSHLNHFNTYASNRMNTNMSRYMQEYDRADDLNQGLDPNLKYLLKRKLRSMCGPKVFYIEITYQEFDNELRRNPFAFPIIQSLTPKLSVINYERDIAFNDVNPIKVVEPSGSVQYFQGSFNSLGQCHGKGVWTQNGNIYIGNFRNDEFSGQGLFINEKGDYYYGGWENSQCTGEGAIVSHQKLAYRGTFRNGKKEGQGEEYYPDGDSYKGGFFNNQKNGKGRYTFSDGSVFDGNFRDSKYNGFGAMSLKGGNIVQGEFRDGKLYGRGDFAWADGNRFTGNFIDNKKQGEGTYIWRDGKSFKAFWKNDQISGNGVYTDPLSGTHESIIIE